MQTEINQYLQHIKSVCPELTDAELIRFSQGLTVTEFSTATMQAMKKTFILFLKTNIPFTMPLLWTKHRAPCHFSVLNLALWSIFPLIIFTKPISICRNLNAMADVFWSKS